MVETIILLLFAHFVSDFILQSNWMAQNKSKDLKALGAHVGVYGLSLLAFLLVWFLPDNIAITALILSFVITNTFFHLITDYITSRITARLWAEGRVHDFFVVIGFDQFIHTSTLILTYVWIFNA